MSQTRVRFELLASLVWQVNGLHRATPIALPRNGEPVLWVSLLDGRRFAVIAVEYPESWVFVWGTFVAPVEPIERASVQIAAVAA